MAVVDSLLRLISAQGADALLIPPGEPPCLEKGGVPTRLSMPYPGDEIVAAMVEEVASAEQRRQLTARKVVETRYAGDDGEAYVVRLEPRDGGVYLAFRRADAEPAAPSSAIETAPIVREAPTTPEPGERPVQAAAPAPLRPPATGLDDGEAIACEPGPLRDVFARAALEDASDILLSVGKPAHLRVGGAIMGLSGQSITSEGLLEFVGPALSERARAELESTGSVDLALLVHDPPALHRFRANLFRQHQGLALALRPIRRQPPTLRELNLPEELLGLAQHRSGLVLMTGTTGSGKSTTLVSLIEHINRSAAKHVITLEDPIEYEYVQQRALIHQRQVGTHVDAFSTGLRAALRESPDVILLGEMRDHETIAAALTAAETGHLVLSTLHAGGAPMAIDRIIDVFPEHQQMQVRLQLAAVLRAIVTQHLLPSSRPPGRVPAIELLRVNTAVATKIREGRGHQLQSEIQKGRGEGMIPIEASLASLVSRGLTTVEAAIEHAPDPTLFQQYLHAR